MATVTDVLNEARKHLGNVGGATFRKPFGAPAGTAWCAYFVSYVLRAVGVDGPWTGWTPYLVSWAKANGRWKTSNPKPGDIVMFMWAGVSPKGRGNPAVCHTGFLEAVNRDGSITTLEGNTSATVGGSQYNGNVMARRIRSGSVIVGYISMDYDGSPATGGGGGVDQNEGYSSEWIRSQQRLLNVLGYGLDADGELGPKTRAAVKDFQSKNGLDADGIPGPATSKKLVEKTTGAPQPPAPAPTPSHPDIRPLQAAVGAQQDDVWGPDTEKRFDALRSATTHHGYKFPYGKAYVQRIVGTSADGIWGPASAKAHDRKVAQIQHILGVSNDGIWGPNTEKAYLAIRSKARKP